MEQLNQSLTPNTTAQQDLTVAGQRRINLVWEVTQSLVAISITASLVYCEINQVDSATIRNGFFLIIGFYFSRTNHAQIGGIGEKPTQEYRGR